MGHPEQSKIEQSNFLQSRSEGASRPGRPSAAGAQQRIVAATRGAAEAAAPWRQPHRPRRRRRLPGPAGKLPPLTSCDQLLSPVTSCDLILPIVTRSTPRAATRQSTSAGSCGSTTSIPGNSRGKAKAKAADQSEEDPYAFKVGCAILLSRRARSKPILVTTFHCFLFRGTWHYNNAYNTVWPL